MLKEFLQFNCQRDKDLGSPPLPHQVSTFPKSKACVLEGVPCSLQASPISQLASLTRSSKWVRHPSHSSPCFQNQRGRIWSQGSFPSVCQHKPSGYQGPTADLTWAFHKVLGLVYHTEMASTQLAEELTQRPSGPVQVPTPESAGQAPLCVACPRSGKNSDQRQAGMNSHLLDQLTGPEMR